MYSVEEVRTSDHVADLVTLGRLMHQEFLDQEFDEDNTRRFCIDLAANEARNANNAWILYEGSAAIGFLTAHAVPRVTYKGVDAHHDLWYVKHAKRHGLGSPALLLWLKFEKWCKSINATPIAGITSDDEARLGEMRILFEKLGYRLNGYSFVKEK